MSALNPSTLWAQLGLLPTRRILVIDPGRHCVKLVVAESLWGQIRFVKRHLLDLEEEGLVSSEEVARQVMDVAHEWGDLPLALPLPQHRSLSQVIDLPPGPDDEVDKLIEEETLKLAGLSETAIIYDYTPLRPTDRLRNPYWITLCQESEIEQQCGRLALAPEEVCEVTTAGNALAAAFLSRRPEADQVVLVDIGSSGSTLVILDRGQPVHTNSFPLGGDVFSETLAAQRSLPLEAAETLKRSTNLLTGPEAVDAVQRAAESWAQEVERILRDWLREQRRESDLFDYHLVLSGGGALLSGLIEFLQKRALRCSLWGEAGPGDEDGRFAVAVGTALHALGGAAQPASLLPARLQAGWKRRRSFQRLLVATLIMAVAATLLLGAGILRKELLAREKSALLREAEAVLKIREEAQAVLREQAQIRQRLRPILARQRDTLDTLATLQLLQEPITNRNVWLVLFADFHSYFSMRPPVQSNEMAATNLPVAASLWSSTNVPPDLGRGFVAEISGPEPVDTMRRTLGHIVVELNENTLFLNVDSLPSDLRRPLVDSEVVASERSYPIQIRLPANSFANVRPPGRRSNGQPSGNGGSTSGTFRERMAPSAPE